jgi:hypothetical protein
MRTLSGSMEASNRMAPQWQVPVTFIVATPAFNKDYANYTKQQAAPIKW